MKTNTICQSCGMPLKKDPYKGGSNADKSRSKDYCSFCFEDGEFIYDCEDVEKFQEFCRQKMVDSGHPRFSAWLFTRGMKRLRRWKH